MDILYKFSRDLAMKYQLSLTAVFLALRIIVVFSIAWLIILAYQLMFGESLAGSGWFFVLAWTLIWGYFGGMAFLLYRDDHTGD